MASPPVEAERHLEEFVYRLSHDLREPVRTVEGFARLLSEDYADRLDARGREYLDFVRTGADRLAMMIGHLTGLSRVRTHGRPFEPVSLTQALASARARLAEDLARSHAHVAHGPLPTVVGDPVQLRELFEHLLDNAVRYRGDAPPRVRITTREEGDVWRIAVADRGLGLDPADEGPAFTPFRRLAPSKVPGDGVGLAYCQRIVAHHGGRIGLDPSPDGGCTVWFTLPRGPRL